MSPSAVYEQCTVLELGARGKLRGAPFTLAGRTTVRSESGGLWNEWTLAFDDGRQGFLAEALGSFTLLFERPIAPGYDALRIGHLIDPGFVVVERGEAQRMAQWGDVPESPRTYRYADLSSAAGETATVDYGSSERGRARAKSLVSQLPDVFVGRRMRLAELGLKPRAGRARFLAARGGLPPNGVTLWLSLGDEGDLDTPHGRARFRVMGIVHRSIRVDGERYTWEEYVLTSPAEELRWLLVADGHWTVVEMLEAGQVIESAEQFATFRGEKHRFLSGGKARVEWASGELPWEVEVGDVTEVRDYLRTPHVLSRESTKDALSWSYGTYMPADTVAQAFGKHALPKPSGRAPNQPKAAKRR